MADNWKRDVSYVEFMESVSIPEPCANRLADLTNCLADLVAYECGDTFIESGVMSPYAQWQRIVKMLDKEGYTIARKGGAAD